MSERAMEGAAPGAPLGKRLQRLGFDPWLLVLALILVVIGLVMVYSSSWDISWRMYDDPNAIFRRQLSNLGIGLAAMLIAARLPLKIWRSLALPIILFTILALAIVLLVAPGLGPRRAFLGGSVQPSEMAKLALIIYLSVWMESKENRLSDWGYGFIPLMLIIGVVAGLILLQPDLSAAFTIVIVAMTMFVLAGARFSQTILITLGSGVIGYMLVRVNKTGQARWDAFLAGLVDIDQASYHVQHALQAFYNGGLIGQGLGASREKFGLLPAPHTDSVYAVLGEELGLVGVLTVLILFWMLFWRGFRIAMASRSKLGMLLASGITFWISLEAMVNMSVLLGLLPFAGNALPFFSYGGSSLVTTLTGVGILLAVSRQNMRASRPGEISAGIGVSGRNRRRRVSRVGGGRRPRRAG
jgi:cell division protein FtsW